MVPDKFNMIDMEGIDIIESQGEVISGLYQKLVESIALCRYQCVYNWKFDGIIIPPTYVEMTIIDNVVWINEGVSVDEEDVIRIYSLEPPAPEPTIQELEVTENGTYTVPSGVDGYNPVVVDVPNTGALIGSDVPTSDIGNIGDYYIQETYSLVVTYGITITKAGRGTNYNFNYWGACDIQLVFENSSEETLVLKDISDKHAWRAAGSGSFNSLDGVIDGNVNNYYETSGLPGYFKISATIPAGYFLTQLKVYARDAANYRDFWRTFSLYQWESDKVPIGSAILDEQELVQEDWNFGSYTIFPINDVVPVRQPEVYLYYKTSEGWVLLK